MSGGHFEVYLLKVKIPVRARGTIPQMPDFLAFVSDMHIAPPSAGAERAQSDLDRPERRAQRLRAALEEIQGLGPSAVLSGGDNTNQPVDSAEYRDALPPFVRQTPEPWFIIPGNHDIGSTVGWHHHDPRRMSEALTALRAALGLAEMAVVPDYHVSPGDDRVAWVALRREGEGWRAELHPLGED